MRKKVLAVVSALVITTLAFTGCGSNKSASSDNGSDSGAKSQAITVVSREEGSGTRGAFVELLGVVDENENDITVSSAQITNSTSVMLQKVAQTKSAIGYVSLGSLSTDVKAVQVDGVDRELYTSFVINARTIATIGGTSAQKDAYIDGTYSSASSAANAITGQHITINAIVETAHTNLCFTFFIISPLFSFIRKMP